MDLEEIQHTLHIKRKRRVQIIGVIVFIIITFSFVLNYQLNQTTVRLNDLNITQAIRGEFTVKLVANGQFKPKSPKLISSEQAGLVTDIFVKPGEFVSVGDKLMQLKNEQILLERNKLVNKIKDLKLQLELKQARLKLDEIKQKAELERLRGSVNVTQAQFSAQKQLAAKGIVSNLDILETSVKLSNYEKQVELGEETLATLSNLIQKELQLSNSQLSQLNSELHSIEQSINELTITARESGRLQSLSVKIGEKIDEGKIVAEVNKLDNLHFVAQIPEREVEQISNFNTARIKVFDDWINGKIEQINPNVTNGFTDVYISFSLNKKLNLKQGQSAKVEIITQTLSNSIYVEKANNYTPFTSDEIWLLDENLAQLRKVNVSFGEASNGLIVVKEGLAGGEKLVISKDSTSWQGHTLSLDI